MNWTSIQWTWAVALDGTLIPDSGSTWNPLTGCRRVSPGCGGAAGVGGCYAERLLATRLSKHPAYVGLSVMSAHGPHFTGERRMVADRLDEPLRTRKARDIFVNDLGDLFFEGHPFEDIAAVFGVMAAARWQTFDVLTKRAKRMREFFVWLEDQARQMMVGTLGARICAFLYRMAKEAMEKAGLREPKNLVPGVWPLKNVRLGVTVEDQKRADERIHDLLACPSPVWFLSVEPQLEAVTLPDVFLALGPRGWALQGGESGPGARPFKIQWMRDMRDVCRKSGTVWFPKQFGAHPIADGIQGPGTHWPADTKMDDIGGAWRVRLADSHGGTESEWPEDLRGLRAKPAM